MNLPATDFDTLPFVRLTFSGELYRSFSLARGNSQAAVLYFGKAGTERYDSPDKSYGVCYLGKTIGGCFIETFGQSMPRVIDLKTLGGRGLATVKAKDLNLLDITGPGAYQIGATGEVWTGDRAISRQWSKAIFGHPDNVDGILYAGKHNSSEHSIALFDRASHKVKLLTTEDWDKYSQLGEILNVYSIALV